jgi:hypothetical protein
VRPNAAVVVTASLLLLALTGCVAPAASVETPTPTPTPAPTPAASALTCDELVPPELVAAALEGADGAAVDPVPASKDRELFDAMLLEGIGGLPCSWRVGSGMPEYNAPSDWAYLRIDVLPGAADEWVPLQFGDAPSSVTRSLAGIEASFAAGDPGWGFSAPAGDAWVDVRLSAAGLTGSGSRFMGLDTAIVIDRLAAVAEAAFTTVQQANPEQLEWPALGLMPTEPNCDDLLDEAGLAAALQLPEGSTIAVTGLDSGPSAGAGLAGEVRSAAGGFGCRVEGEGFKWTTITVAPGLTPLFDRLGAPDGDAGFEPLALADAPADVRGVIQRDADGSPSLAYASIAGTVFEVEGSQPAAIVQAIVGAQSG